jgi:hypothetical protein
MLQILSNDGTVAPVLLVWCIGIGAILAFCYNFFSQTICGKIIRKMLESGSIGEENAKSLSELNEKPTLFTKLFLKDKGLLRHVVEVKGGKFPLMPLEKKDVCDFDAARFYIPEAKEEKARARYSEPLKLRYLLLFTVLAILVSIAMSFAVPMVLGWVGM